MVVCDLLSDVQIDEVMSPAMAIGRCLRSEDGFEMRRRPGLAVGESLPSEAEDNE